MGSLSVGEMMELSLVSPLNSSKLRAFSTKS